MAKMSSVTKNTKATSEHFFDFNTLQTKQKSSNSGKQIIENRDEEAHFQKCRDLLVYYQNLVWSYMTNRWQ